jgi:hypothetical protein
MRLVLRWALTLILIPIAAFCCFGFLASGGFEPPSSIAFRWLYWAAAVACIVSLVAVWLVKAGRR